MELRHIARRSGQLSSFLRGELQMSAGLMNRLKWGDAIRVNGQPRKTNFPVRPGDVITVALEEPQPDYPAEDGFLDILYEDPQILVVDKPQGMLIHPSRSKNTGTLANLVLGHYRKAGLSCAFHPLTRLDRDTFGVVVIGKNAHICTLLQAGPLEKTYHALVWGTPPAEEGVIDAPIARLPLPSLLRRVSAEGKPSVTKYRVLERTDAFCKLELQPVTGRTHQLRVHCAHMGCPILGDPQYGSLESQHLSRQLGLSGQMLCAKTIAFAHPVTGEAMVISSHRDVGIGGR